METIIRTPYPAEIDTIFEMMRRFAAFEDLTEYMTADPAELRAAVFGENAFVEALIAVCGDVPAGYAIFYPHFSSFRGESGYYLEDIYIDEAFRGSGVGKALLRAIARLGRERGFTRIDFQVSASNSNAISFYRSLGAVANEDERHFKFSDAAFEMLAQ
ncbi:MAG: GNAT family N-acetyltransferase [Acidobacteria bacterium]|nr:GNAT family N-acetyltransferase [Acidobacteriota bacterium]